MIGMNDVFPAISKLKVLYKKVFKRKGKVIFNDRLVHGNKRW